VEALEAIATVDEPVRWTEARCATGDARLLHLFFSEDPREIAEAKEFCQECPLRRPCLLGAIQREEPWGVWGGHLFDQGRVIGFKRGRGRPRKEEVQRQREVEEQIALEIDVA